MNDLDDNVTVIDLAAHIVAAYVGHNSVPASDLPNLIYEVVGALNRVQSGPVEAEPEPVKPAVPVKKSVTPDYIVCLEDGKKFKSLKRHLRTHYNMSPEEYREKWGLPRTIRWSLRTTLPRGRNWRRRWASVSSAVAAADFRIRQENGPDLHWSGPLFVFRMPPAGPERRASRSRAVSALIAWTRPMCRFRS